MGVKTFERLSKTKQKILTILCAPFPSRIFHFQGPGYAFGLCALFIADTNPRGPCVSRSLEVGNTFLILCCFQSK